MIDPAQSLAALRLSRLPGVGASSFRALVERHGSPAAALASLEGAPARRPKSATAGGLERARRWVEDGREILYNLGPGYPSPLGELSEAPPVLFVDGDAGALSAPMAAVVGGREAPAEALEAAREAGRRCAEAGFCVVNGGARGVDGAALEGALEAGGAAVVVLGCGVDVVYPPEHRGLFERCRQRGALVSELLPGAPPMRSFFVTRNRIIAGLSSSALMVWGREGSGALVTLRWARKLGRTAAALRWPAGAAGCEQAIAAGASVACPLRGDLVPGGELTEARQADLAGRDLAALAALRAHPPRSSPAVPCSRGS